MDDEAGRREVVRQALSAKGRGSQINPTGRFRRIEVEEEFEYFEHDAEALSERRRGRTEYFVDDAKSVVSENDSPDVPFRYSLNAYRGCLHGCSYCYARPSHEYLDLSAGLDFETKIFVKERAPELLRDWLCREGYVPEAITLSGVTDCYQPVERKLRLTRRCLEVAREACQPIAVITKNGLVTRDVDLFGDMAKLGTVSVGVSVTSLDQSLTRVMEPRTSSPAARLEAIATLSLAGVPVHVLVAPVVPGLTDHEIPAILRAASEAGARSASYVLLRLPMTVEPVFLEWLARALPDRRSVVESRIRSTRGGDLYESGFGVRMRGEGPIAEQIGRTFELFAKRFGLKTGESRQAELDCSRFRRPVPRSGQRWLFDR